VALQMLLRPQAGLNNGDLVGRYHFVHFTPSHRGSSTWGQMAFDAFGTGLVVTTPETNEARQLLPSNLEGVEVSVQGTGTGELVLLAHFSATAPAPAPARDTFFEGCTGDGGRLLLAMRTDDSQEPLEPTVYAAVRAGRNANASLLSGSYQMFLFITAPDIPDVVFATLRGTLTADGIGSATFQGVIDESDGFHGNKADSGVYTVASDGELELDVGPIKLIGGIDSGGDRAVLGGMNDASHPPVFGFLIRSP
jgi:hypothetical protein